jgi:hypothetical protein
LAIVTSSTKTVRTSSSVASTSDPYVAWYRSYSVISSPLASTGAPSSLKAAQGCGSASRSRVLAVTDVNGTYAITLNLNVLNHLGLNLYSNVPSVLSEVVANSWDADATEVDVDVDLDAGVVTITDNGAGMTRAEVNQRYLNVGYQRRLDTSRPAAERAKTPIHRRPVMGRKGIGKLSLFSVARIVEVHTVKDDEVSAFRMSVEELRTKIQSVDGEGTYNPDPIPSSNVAITAGTRLILSDLKRGLGQTPSALRRRLARRFAVIGPDHDFEVRIDGRPITVEDRDYFHKVQYLWTIGAGKDRYLGLTKKSRVRHEHRSGTLDSGARVSGWLATAETSTALKDEYDNLNRVIVMVRGKLAQEDILEEFNEGGVYSKYVFGEIHADFLDRDDADDIATSSRQRIIEDDFRYVELRSFVLAELKNIQSVWTDLRNKEGEVEARKIPEVDEWFKSLGLDARRKARSLLGKINQLTIDNDRDRRRLIQHAVLAFETLRYKENLAALDAIDAENLDRLATIWGALDDLEATLYHRIVTERLQVIDKLNEHVEGDALEKVVQRHLFEHLWLLDPSWERATDAAYIEQAVEKEFNKLKAAAPSKEKSGRVDLKYRKTSGTHVIVELKRPGRTVTSYDLIPQVTKYREALRRELAKAHRDAEPIEVVCIVGKELRDWSETNGREESEKLLAAKGIRVVMYQELLDGASKAYATYIEKRVDAGRVQALLDAIDPDVYGDAKSG